MSRLENNIERQVYREQITSLFQGIWIAAISSFAIPLLIAYVQRDHVPLTHLVSWVLFFYLIVSLRIILARSFSQSVSSSDELPIDEYTRWMRRHLVLTTISGVGVGVVMYWVTAQGLLEYELFNVFIILVTVTGSLTNLAPYFPVFASFATVCLVPAIVYFFMGQTEFHIVIGVLLFLYYLVLIKFARGQNQKLMQWLILRLRNDELNKKMELSQKFGNVGSWEYDLGEGELQFNDATLRMLGWTEESISLNGFIGSIGEEHRGEVKKAFEKLSSKDKALNVEFYVTQENETIKWFAMHGAFVDNLEESEDKKLLGSIFDVTSIKIQEVLEHEAREAAERASQAKTVLTRNIAHELRTPLNAILGFAELLQNDNDLEMNEKQRELLGHIYSAGEHLLALINELLDLARMETAQISVDIDKVSVKAVVDECHNLLCHLALAREIQLFVDINDVYVVSADDVRLKQVLINLVTNAIKYNRPGGKVIVRACPGQQGFVRLEVEDSGQGISDEDIEKLFRPFERLAVDDSAIEGTGIGLNISKKLMELMNGKIGVESRANVGSIFWVELPVA